MDALVSTDWLARELGAPAASSTFVGTWTRPVAGATPGGPGTSPERSSWTWTRTSPLPAADAGSLAGRHPWPDEAQVARVMSAAGIGPGVRVVAYDDASGSIAARLWYLLRAYGHDDVAVLDGGIAKWQAEGRPLSTEEPRVEPAVFVPRARPGFVVAKPEMVREHARRLVLDARASERYRGEREPVDPRAGHVPGAMSAPWTENLTQDAVPVFRPREALRERYEALGAGREEPVVYCGSGVTACHDLLALHVAGLRGTLYAGSWSEWSSDPKLPGGDGRRLSRRAGRPSRRYTAPRPGPSERTSTAA